jgi:ribonuclease HI
MAEQLYQCRARGCSVRSPVDALLCKAHWAYVPPTLRAACRDADSQVAQDAADAAAVAFVDAIPKIKGYEEHGSLPSPHQARCSVCGELSWLCPHEWSLRIPAEKFEAVGRGLPWPCTAADVVAAARVPSGSPPRVATPSVQVAPAASIDSPRDEVGTFEAPATLEAWSIGAGAKKDGAIGVGVVMVRAGEVLAECSECVGLGTDHSAEVRAVNRALTLAAAIEGTQAHVLDLFTTEFVRTKLVGTLSESWLSHATPALITAVRATRDQARQWPHLRIHCVPSQSAVAHSQRADRLAQQARRRGILLRAVEQAGIATQAGRLAKAVGGSR